MKNEAVLKNVNDGKVTSDNSSHPVGTTLGTVGGAAVGIAGTIATAAAAGAVVGPAGAALGAAVGAVAGAFSGHQIAAQVNPKEEDLFWREAYSTRPYVTAGAKYETYQPAYTYGIESYSSNPQTSFDKIEPSLAQDWNNRRGTSTLEWNDAKPAARDAYDRLYARKPSDM